jgi:hypothetical protein
MQPVGHTLLSITHRLVTNSTQCTRDIVALVLVRTVAALAIMTLAFCNASSRTTTPTVDAKAREVAITAVVQPNAMDCWIGGVKGHHAIVWNKGRAHRCALFASEVSDHDLLALNSVGGRAGENLTPDSWNARNDERNPEPDKRVVGTPVDVFVEWNGSNGRHPLAAFLNESGHATPQLDLRYGGNERFQKEFKSGCIVCLYSCPGGAIGNHVHPIRDYVRHGVVYSSRRETLPRAGTRVTIIFRVRTEAS